MQNLPFLHSSDIVAIETGSVVLKKEWSNLCLSTLGYNRNLTFPFQFLQEITVSAQPNPGMF